MTLETLANDIAAAAEKDAKALIAEAKAEAKQLLADAEAKASALRDEAQQRAEKEATQIARETVASARQSNQKDVLIARRGVLDATYEAARDHIADPGMKGRAALLKTLLSQSKKLAKGKFVILPVEVDRKLPSRKRLATERSAKAWTALAVSCWRQKTARCPLTCDSTTCSIEPGPANSPL